MNIVIKDCAKPTLLDNLKVQYRVIRALMLRQILLRWGRNNIGYLWLFIEPLIYILVIFGFSALVNGNGFERMHFGIAAIPFLFLGVSQAMAWRFVSHKCAGVFSGNIPLLEHKLIRPLDLFLACAIVEVLGVSVAVLSIYIILLGLGIVELPNSISLLVVSWCLILWFSLAYGVFFGALSGAFDFIDFAMRGINVLFYFVSGVFFSVAWLPEEYQRYLLWLPMIHGTEMLRHAYFGNKFETFESPVYLVIFNIVFSFMALGISRASWLEDIRE